MRYIDLFAHAEPGCVAEMAEDAVGQSGVARGGPRTRLTGAMPFGQHPGPPATSRQINELLELLHAAGHEDFRDARGPMGFTQRQAAGKFTRVRRTS